MMTKIEVKEKQAQLETVCEIIRSAIEMDAIGLRKFDGAYIEETEIGLPGIEIKRITPTVFKVNFRSDTSAFSILKYWIDWIDRNFAIFNQNIVWWRWYPEVIENTVDGVQYFAICMRLAVTDKNKNQLTLLA